MEGHWLCTSDVEMHVRKDAFIAGIASAIGSAATQGQTDTLVELVNTPEHEI